MEAEKKKRGPRRSKAEIEADLERRLARSKWSGVKAAIGLLTEADKAVEEAQAAAGEKAQGVQFDAAILAISDVCRALEAILPPEAM